MKGMKITMLSEICQTYKDKNGVLSLKWGTGWGDMREKGRGRRNRRRIEGVNKIKVCFMYKSYCVQLIDVKENIMAIKSSYTLKTCYQGGVRIGKKNKNMLSILSTYSL
jgi:hypothetical protein